MFHWPEEVPLFCASTQLHVLGKKTNHQASSCLARTAYESFLIIPLLILKPLCLVIGETVISLRHQHILCAFM